MNATLASQRTVEAPLGELALRVREAGLGTPAVVAVGDVVRLRESLAWFERRPLFGLRVLVTRPRGRAAAMTAALTEAGAEAVCLPMIELGPPADPTPLDAALDVLSGYDGLLFTSANAVRFTAERALARGVDLAASGVPVWCVGPATARAAAEAGLAPAHTPAERFDADGLADAVASGASPTGRRFLLPRAEAAREVLPERLRAAGARVDSVAAYRTAAPERDGAALREQLAAGALHALTFASPSAARHFAELLDEPARAGARRCWIAAIGPVTAEALREQGLPPDVEPERADGAGLVAALAARVAADRSRGDPADTGGTP